MSDLDRYYRMLGLEPGASFDEVDQAYRDLAKIWHPSQFPNDPGMQEHAEQKLKEINEAYGTLRTAFGRTLRTSGQASAHPQSAPPFQQRDREKDSGTSRPVAASTRPTAREPAVSTKTQMPEQRSQQLSWLAVIAAFLILRLISGTFGTLSKPSDSSPPISRPPSPEITTKTVPKATVEGPTLVSPKNPKVEVSPPRPEAIPEVSKAGPKTQPDRFTLGSTKDEVRGIQGTPTSVWKLAFTETWWYGSSYVEFDRNGRVQGYSNNGGILRIQVVPSKHSSSAYFTLGSTEDDVLSTMGTPSSIQKLAFTETWWYGSAYVEFNRNRKVQGYSNSTGNLRVVLAPKINIRSASFTIGSTKNEVLAAQGTPTSVSKLAFTETWWYGSSYVEFDTGGRVRAYSNLSGDLRIR